MQDSQWPAAVFALGILAAITAITVAAIWKYDTVDDALKIWAVLSGLIGVVIGAAATRFFTKSAVTAASSAATEAAKAASSAEAAAMGAKDAASAAQQTIDVAQRQAAELTAAVQTMRSNPPSTG